MSYTHFTIIERSKIEAYFELKYSIRELKRNPDYKAEKAQENYKKKKACCGAQAKLSPDLKIILQEKLNQTWPPEQIVGRLFPD